MIIVDCGLFSENENYGYKKYVDNLLGVFLSENDSVKSEFTFIFKSSSRKYLLDNFGSQFLDYCLFVKDFLWRLRLQLVLRKFNIDYPFILNTYNQSVYPLYKGSVHTIVHDHQFMTRFHKLGLRKLFYKSIFSLFKADGYIGISNTTMYEQIKLFSDLNKCNYIYNPIDISLYKTKENVNLPLKGNNLFLFVGSDKEYKNQEYLIKEFEDFYLKYKSGLLVCVGGVHVTSNAPIVCLRDLPQEQLNFLYENCCAVVLPSLYEGYCYPFAEAKLFNKTVVAYDMPISREMLQSGDDLFIDGKAGALVQAFIRLSRNTSTSRNGNDNSSIRFTDNYFERLLSVLVEI